MRSDSRFWMFFGGIWLVVGIAFAVTSLGVLLFADPATVNEPRQLWVFLVAGLLASSAGGYIVRRARALERRETYLLEAGIQLTGTVTEIRRSAIRINREIRWHVGYRYQYTSDRVLEGQSQALPSSAVEGIQPGDRVLIKVDPQQPEESLFLGTEGQTDRM